jgi:putative ABC transport system substrate-binding protein
MRRRDFISLIGSAAASRPLTARPLAGNTPIVFVNVADPVSSGFVASLARPDGNITGFTASTLEWARALGQDNPRPD